MSYNPIGRLLKVTDLTFINSKLNHVPMATINPPQNTADSMRYLMQSNPQGSIPTGRRWRSVTMAVEGKTKEFSVEKDTDGFKERKSLDRHLVQPFVYSEKVYSKPKKGQEDMSKTIYQHTDEWNKSVTMESKRRKTTAITKEQILQKLQKASKAERDQFLLKQQNQENIIEAFFLKLKKALKSKAYLKQYGDSFDGLEDIELLRKLFASFARSKGISLMSRTDQLLVTNEELREFCKSIGFKEKERGLYQVDEFYDAVFNPALLGEQTGKQTQLNLQQQLVGAPKIPGQALIRKTNMISMRAVIFNYKRFLHQNFDILSKFSKAAASHILIELYQNIQPWILQKKQLRANLTEIHRLEEEYMVPENFQWDPRCFDKINTLIQQRSEQIEEKLIISKFLYAIVLKGSLTMETLRTRFIIQIVEKATKIGYLEEFLKGILEYMEQVPEDLQEDSDNVSVDINSLNSISQVDSQQQSGQSPSHLSFQKIADFIQQEEYSAEECDTILGFLLKIKNEFNSQEFNSEYLLRDDILAFCKAFKERQDLKQGILQEFIEKTKQFYDKHCNCEELNERNSLKFERNTICKYALQKMQKYDQIIANRAFKLSDILNLEQKRTVFKYDLIGCEGDPPLDGTDIQDAVQKIMSIDRYDMKRIIEIFQPNFVVDYFKEQTKIKEKIQAKRKTWDSEINQALQLYQQESLRLINALSSWNPPADQRQQSRKSSFLDSKQKKYSTSSSTKKGKNMPILNMNKAHLHAFVDNENNPSRDTKEHRDSNSKRYDTESVRSGQRTVTQKLPNTSSIQQQFVPSITSLQSIPLDHRQQSQQQQQYFETRTNMSNDRGGSQQTISLSRRGSAKTPSQRFIPKNSSEQQIPVKPVTKASQYLEQARKLFQGGQNGGGMNFSGIGEGGSLFEIVEQEIKQMQQPLMTLTEESEVPINPDEAYMFKTNQMYEDICVLLNSIKEEFSIA